jgi:hypothetical protein
VTLIPVYIVGFILGGLVLFAIAKRVPNRTAKSWLRTIGVLAGPVFFLVVAIFSGWKRQKSYEMEWLTGRPAVEYLGHGIATENSGNDLVVLRRESGYEHECFEKFVSSDLAQYLSSLSTHTVKVQFEITYDFYQVRSMNIETIGEFGHDAASTIAISRGWREGGEKRAANAKGIPCFSW